MTLQTRPARLRRLAQRLGRDTSGLALIEFALSMPILMGLGMVGLDTGYYTVTHLQVSQVAMQVADNASRVGEAELNNVKLVRERDIAEVLIGAEKLGDSIGIFEKGRVIISSLQVNQDNGQWIAWQRCRGAKRYVSNYGVEGIGRTGNYFVGMGDAVSIIRASPGTAVIFVEVSYTFESPVPISMFEEKEIHYTAAFNIRDTRDLTGGPLQNGMHTGGPVARCDRFSAERPT
jgi:hypothetical protein